MHLVCNPALGERHKSASQRARSITEGWFTAEGYCLNCRSNRVELTTAGTPFSDHRCPVCGQTYEMKSAKKAHTRIVQNGGYESMMREIRAERPPVLLLMQYDPAWCVQQLVAVHPVFLTPDVIRKRAKPHVRPRSGALYWMCDFDLTVIPEVGKIAVVRGREARAPRVVREEFAALQPLREVSNRTRGWTGLVLDAVKKIGKPMFTLAEVYTHEAAMHAAYPGNSHVRDKIRQQLQVLRELGYVEFVERGMYRVL